MALHRPPPETGPSEDLEEVLSAPLTAERWGVRRAEIEGHFREFLGEPTAGIVPGADPAADRAADPAADPAAAPVLLDEWVEAWARVKLFEQVTGPATKQLLLLLAPLVDSGRRPAAVVPFYHPDESAGIDLRERVPSAPARNNPDTPLAVRAPWLAVVLPPVTRLG